MSKNNEQQNGEQAKSQSETAVAYVKPLLTAYGDVRDITFGPSPGGFESGSTFTCDRSNPGSCP